MFWGLLIGAILIKEINNDNKIMRNLTNSIDSLQKEDFMRSCDRKLETGQGLSIDYQDLESYVKNLEKDYIDDVVIQKNYYDCLNNEQK